MAEKLGRGEQFNWRLPLYVAAGAATVLLLLMVYSADGPLLYILFIAPIVCLISLILLVATAIYKRRLEFLSALSALAALLVISVVLLKNEQTIRPALRWLMWSHRFKAEVLAQPEPTNGDLKHMEWDGWGFPGAGDTQVYLVFDPDDSLRAAAKSRSSGKFRGIPCEVPGIHRLEADWYSVQFYTDEWWGRRNVLNCE